MSLKQAGQGAWLGAAVVAALLAAGCANPRPAPVVNRTGIPQQAQVPPEAPAPPPVEALPGQQPGQPGVAGVPGTPGVGETPGVIATPIPSGTIEAAPIQQGAAPVDPNLKTGPSGIKRPYGEMASVDQRNLQPGGSTAPAASAPAVVSTSASPSAPLAAQPKPQPAPPAPVATAPSTATPAPAPAGGTGTLDGVPFGWPVSGNVLETFDQTSNKGLSLAGKAGDTVRAAADGRVIFSGAGPRGYGNLVIVKHDKELLSVYAHNRSLAVKEGQAVKRGQKIAELGNSGTDVPKLHFEIRQQGKPIDPLAVLPRR